MTQGTAREAETADGGGGERRCKERKRHAEFHGKRIAFVCTAHPQAGALPRHEDAAGTEDDDDDNDNDQVNSQIATDIIKKRPSM